jgi:hypothetical protein
MPPRPALRIALWAALCAGPAGCSRAPAGAPVADASGDTAREEVPAPGSSAPSDGSLSAPISRPALAPPRSGEAERGTVQRLEDDPLLRSHLPALREHFGAGARGPFEVQRSVLAGGATALLVSLPNDGDPFVLVVDRDQPLWTKARPVAGILPPVRHLALAPRPDGGVVVFGWVETLRTVAARMWADDSNPFGDFEIFAPDACDALSAAYAPGFGWVVVCSGKGGARAARMRDDGTAAWGRLGVPVGAPSAVGPSSVAFDTPSSFLLLQRAAAAGGERILGYRYDGRAMDLWAAPVDLGGIGIAAGAGERIVARSLDKGVRVDPLQGRAVRGKPLEVAPDGSVRVASH